MNRLEYTPLKTRKMKENFTQFVNEIKPEFYQAQNENVLNALLKEYERVIFRSIFTAFGLDSFIQDQYGGDVDTIHNVRKVGQDLRIRYKRKVNEAAYDNREKYVHSLAEGENFRRIKHDARIKYGEDNKKNTVQDAYEDKQLHFLGKGKGRPTGKNAELDHVVAAKKIYDDRGRVLSGLSTEELADSEDNLKWTNEHLNKSMGQQDIPDYIDSHPELSEDTKAHMMDAYNQAQAAYEQSIEKAYYFDFSNSSCRDFYRGTFLAAGKRGVQMGLREAIGFLVMKLCFDIKDKVIECDGTVKGVVSAIREGFKNWSVEVKKSYKEIFIRFGENLIGGITSSLSSTFINTFITTSENIEKIIRQAWSSIVEATSVLLFNSKEKYFCDRMTSAARILATGASMIVGTSVQEKIMMRLDRIAIPIDLKSIISTFAGTLCTGLLSVTLLVYIDNDPFGGFLDKYYGQYGRQLHGQEKVFKRYCAKLQSVNIEELDGKAEYIYELSNDLQYAKNNNEINRMLSKAMKDLGIRSLWEGSSLDLKMKDDSWVLKF